MAAKKNSPSNPKHETPQAEAQAPTQAEVKPEPPALPHTAKALARMGAAAKLAIKQGAEPDAALAPVLQAHKAYLSAVAKGAEASDEDQRFVRNHMSALRNAHGV